LLVGSLATSAILRSVNWRNHRAAAFLHARRLFEEWEQVREDLLQAGLASADLDQLSSVEPFTETVKLPPGWVDRELIRLPLLKRSSPVRPFPRWGAFQNLGSSPCVPVPPEPGSADAGGFSVSMSCRNAFEVSGIQFLRANIDVPEVTVSTERTALIATGSVRIAKLRLPLTAHLEIIAGGPISIDQVESLTSAPDTPGSSSMAELLLHSVHGAVKCEKVTPEQLEKCLPENWLKVRIESRNQGLFGGCGMERIPEIWTNTDFLGEIELKSLFDSDKLR